MWWCLSTPRFSLGSTSGQTVRPLPSVTHESERLAATLLERWIQHLFMWKVNLWGVTTRQSSVTQLSRTVRKSAVQRKHFHTKLLMELFTWKIVFHVLPSASRRRSLSLQPLKYRTHGGRKCARSDANSCTKQKQAKRRGLQQKLPQTNESNSLNAII